ncbi:tRNA (adenosine(37)-N6)-threonylcarbamoyltransferase complex ATPase subunit type 1 TsaE [Candidatus Uhrbacteria bacterium]|nr:tRNA (adenosine(37)-N6)-threonylcarbamoyltransferase complex ATPase subunit type 1 TsaE [Candidatus Uhrbacteria bacterium]
MTRFTLKNEQQTLALARRLARTLRGGDVLLLQGELGAGKTTFVRGLARALGVRSRIKSPTFTLIHVHELAKGKEHRAKGTLHKTLSSKLYALRYLVHCDAYRIKRARELRDAGLMDWLGRPDTLVVVEWGEKIKPLLKGRRYILIKFEHGEQGNQRIIKMMASLQS